MKKTIPLDLSMEERISWASRMVIKSELIIFTSILIVLVGNQRALELVVPTAKQAGQRVGTMMNGAADGGGDLSMIKEKMEFLGSVIQQNRTPAMISGSNPEREIVDCPLKGAAPEVCMQFEGVFNGACEAINPYYAFSYDRMMSKGDHSCHWVVKKKSVGTVAKPQESIPDDSLGY